MDTKAQDMDSKDLEHQETPFSTTALDLEPESYRWWRGTFTQTTILGVCSFVAPGESFSIPLLWVWLT